MNYFEILDLQIEYKIDLRKLIGNYLLKQKNSESVSESLNEAYNVLKDDIRRAEYFLKLHDISVENISPQASIEMFELRENYEEIKDHESQIAFQKNLEDKIERMILSLSDCENDLKKFVEIFGVVKFISSFLEKVKSDVYSRN